MKEGIVGEKKHHVKGAEEFNDMTHLEKRS